MTKVVEQRAVFVRRQVMILCGIAGCASAAPLFGQSVGGWMATPMAQSNGATVQTPLNRPVSRQSKLTLTVDTRWTNNYGYRPVEVTISSPNPTATDHLITVRLHSGWDSRMDVEQNFELPLGGTSATTTIAVPQYQPSGQFFWWDVWVDGIQDEDLSLSATDLVNRMGSSYGSATGLSLLAVGPMLPGIKGGASQRTLVAPNTLDFEVLSLWISEFPRRWIDYTCLDVVMLSWGELQLLSATNPQAFAAMKGWLRAGGQLWVGEVGDEFEELDDLSKLFRLRASIGAAVKKNMVAAVADKSDDDSPAVGWQPVRFRNGIREGQVVTFLDLNTGDSRVVRDPDEVLRLQNDANFVVTDQRFELSEQETAGRRWPLDSSEWFVEQRLGLGSVRAFREITEVSLFTKRLQPADPNAAADEVAGRMPRSLSMALRSADRWSVRHGTAPDDANRDFANLLVPGVGLAPVTEFRVLITLFVLLIGPVNYWLLKRWRRLHLLVLTVPLAAALMSAALFAYAAVSDGFGTAVRAHSFTVLDQRSGDAACWTQLSYYSGLAPGKGLTMPADVVLYPIHPPWNIRSMDAVLNIKRDIVWDGDEARLTRGWLRSRTPTQYLTVRARKTPHRLELAAGGGKLRATNRLGTAIHLGLVFDQQGKLWVGEEMAADSVLFLKPIERTDAIRRFRQLVMANEPEPPAALADGDSHYAVLQRQSRQMFRGRFGIQQSEVRLTTSAVNERLAELAGLSGRPPLELPPRSYVAVTSTGSEVEFGIVGAKEEASFHVIVGQW